MDTQQYSNDGDTPTSRTLTLRNGKKRGSAGQLAAEHALYRQNMFRKECASLVSRSLAKLRDFSLRKHLWQKARHRSIVKTLFGVTWHRFLGAVTTILQQSEDPSMQCICLDALKYCCAS